MNRAQQKLHLLEKSVSAATTRVWPSVKCLFSLWDKQCLSHGPAWSPPSGCHSWSELYLHGCAAVLAAVLWGTSGCLLLEFGPLGGPLCTFMWITKKAPFPRDSFSWGRCSYGLGPRWADLGLAQDPIALGWAEIKYFPWWLYRHLLHIYPPPKSKDKIQEWADFTSQHLECLVGLLAYCTPPLSWPAWTSSAHFTNFSSKPSFFEFQVNFSYHNFHAQEPS